MGVTLAIRERSAGPVMILDLEGDITIGSQSDAFSRKLEELIQQGQKYLLLNLARVTRIDSSGLSALVRAYVSLYRQKGALKILQPTGYVRDVLNVTNLFERIESYDDEKTALESFH